MIPVKCLFICEILDFMKENIGFVLNKISFSSINDQNIISKILNLYIIYYI